MALGILLMWRRNRKLSKSKYRIVPQYPSGFYVEKETGSHSFWPFKAWWPLDYFHTQKDAEEYILCALSEEKQKEEFYKNNPPYRFP